jgi:hypothetical protein
VIISALDGADWQNILHAAADISRILDRPLRVIGEPKEALPSAIAAIEEVRRSGRPPLEMRACG